MEEPDELWSEDLNTKRKGKSYKAPISYWNCLLEFEIAYTVRPLHTEKDFHKNPTKMPCHETLHGVYQNYGVSKNRGQKIRIM